MVEQECEEVPEILCEIYSHGEKGTWVASLILVLLLAQCSKQARFPANQPFTHFARLNKHMFESQKLVTSVLLSVT